MFKKIYLDAPNVGTLEKRYLNSAIDTGYISTVGPLVPEFEEKFAKYLSVQKAVSTQSGTAAIHMALYELGIGKGDEVIVPALTFVATVNPIIYVGAKPVFVDVDIKTWNISPSEIEKRITQKTKAIIPVHFYGNPCNMSEVMNIARRHNIYVIEDATESLGAKYRNRYTGTFGDFGCFSFNGNKVITTGGGGMLAGTNQKRLKHIKFLINQAREERREYYHPEVGFNYRMTNLEAAMGLAQITKIGAFLKKKRELNRIYRQELRDIGFIKFQEEYKGANSSWWMTCIMLDKKINIIRLEKRLKRKGIPTRRTFMPIVEFSPYKTYKTKNYKNSYEIYRKSLCLPTSTLNSDDDMRYVCNVFKKILL